MSILTILLFFIYTLGLGFSLSFFLKNSENFLERNIMRIGFGLGTIPILGVILNILNIPLDWRVFLLLSVIAPIYFLYANFKKGFDFGFKLTKADLYTAGAIVIFCIGFFMYASGSFSYPWLENGDPWEYATSTQYVAQEKTFSKPEPLRQKFLETGDVIYYTLAHYSEPYPVGFSMVFGLLKQTSPNMIWTLKFFNSLILSLGILFFYFLVRQLTNNSKIALLSTLIFLAIPSYLTHFIYSQTLAMTIFFPALYTIERTLIDRKFGIIGAVNTSSILITQMVSAMLFASVFLGSLFIIYLLFSKKQAKTLFVVGISAVLLASLYWGTMINVYGIDGIKAQNAIPTTTAPIKVGGSDKQFVPLSIFYSFQDKIDGPYGLGLGVFVVLICSIIIITVFWKNIFRKSEAALDTNNSGNEKRKWISIAVLWLILILINIESAPLPIGLVPHRSWPYLAIGASIISGYGIFMLISMFKKSIITKSLLLIAIFAFVFLTSFTYKWQENTVIWPQHKFVHDPNGDLGGYLWLASLPEGTKVTSLCRKDNEVISFDKASDSLWDVEQIEFKNQILNKTADEIRSFYKDNKYIYFIIDSQCVETLGLNETNDKINELLSAGFQLRQPQQFKN